MNDSRGSNDGIWHFNFSASFNGIHLIITAYESDNTFASSTNSLIIFSFALSGLIHDRTSISVIIDMLGISSKTSAIKAIPFIEKGLDK